MALERVLHRFEREAKSLARLSHPEYCRRDRVRRLYWHSLSGDGILAWGYAQATRRVNPYHGRMLSGCSCPSPVDWHTLTNMVWYTAM